MNSGKYLEYFIIEKVILDKLLSFFFKPIYVFHLWTLSLIRRRRSFLPAKITFLCLNGILLYFE